MKRQAFWSGFAAGAGVIAGSWIGLNLARRGGMSPIVRLEKSVQVGASFEDVFDAWANFRLIPQHVSMVKEVRVFGHRTHWRIRIAGASFEWDAEITQLIPYQAIGWKSMNGPKHSGRITFAPIGNDTNVHVHMNYAPAGRLLRPMAASIAGDLEGFIEQALREFKKSLETGNATVRRQQNPASPLGTARHAENPAAATGTYGPGSELMSDQENARVGAASPVEPARPPEAKD
jgi:uncharacterized membrane protein